MQSFKTHSQTIFKQTLKLHTNMDHAYYVTKQMDYGVRHLEIDDCHGERKDTNIINE